MRRVRGEEQWAARCIGSALGGMEVQVHDDGSKPGMHDLQIMYAGRPPGAVEITAAADAESIELWNLINGGGRWVEPDLIGGWGVALLPKARARTVQQHLPALLRQLEQAGVREVQADPWSRGSLEKAAYSLGITHLFQGGTQFPGSIYPTIDLPAERSGGVVPDTGDPLADWLAEWIRRPEQAHNLTKLLDSGAEERHLFVILPGFANAPYEVMDLLWRDGSPLPRIRLSLPPEVTHVWAMSTWSGGSGMRWAPKTRWQHFDKALDQEPGERGDHAHQDPRGRG